MLNFRSNKCIFETHKPKLPALKDEIRKAGLIEIECGEDDMPLYVRGPLENETRAKQIIAQLEAKAGPGNYKVVWQDDDDNVEDDLLDDDLRL